MLTKLYNINIPFTFNICNKKVKKILFSFKIFGITIQSGMSDTLSSTHENKSKYFQQNNHGNLFLIK